ncbi:Aste57867_14795 [Aphanomyces stellatus]|uniref:Aste57867_14795 protein n=1 Tax=Aphanomyces stellatus TaxID=120398 RepID=A0A485L1L9_9STRA|nr:hypothetical protein As57867_014740 [Aphanomyces stellatus]VFT91613.1 Aste57867_14795 [Aphanomyces stellatus]
MLFAMPLVALADGNATTATCGAIVPKDDYDHPMHVAAIFIIFGVSLLGSMLPVISNYISCLRNSRKALSLLNSFGFGVVVATAFIHMIPPAIDTLNSPCLALPYKGLAMVIVVFTILIMQVTETELVLAMTAQPDSSSIVLLNDDNHHHHMPKPAADSDYHVECTPNAATMPSTSHRGGGHHHHAHQPADQKSADTRKKINVVIFEIGVAIHSVIIGLNLGVATGAAFTTLLVALCFHQFFEGVAVGSSAVSAFKSARNSIYTAIGYSFTTPLGIVLGIAINSSYSDTSSASLWVRGTLDAIAGGILVYTGLVELLTYQYTINQEFHDKSRVVRALNYIFLWLGAGAMAVVGYWT